MSIGIKVKGLPRLLRKLEKMPSATERELDLTVRGFGEALLASAIRHASGRPGPNVVTGQYIAAMTLQVGRRKVTVYNNSPQARRLEYGFYGTDSLGRVYHQPPFPHMRPALIETFTMYEPKFRDVPLRAWRSL